MSVNTSQKCERSKIETRWFPDKGSSGVFESWVAPKLGGRSGPTGCCVKFQPKQKISI